MHDEAAAGRAKSGVCQVAAEVPAAQPRAWAGEPHWPGDKADARPGRPAWVQRWRISRGLVVLCMLAPAIEAHSRQQRGRGVMRDEGGRWADRGVWRFL